MLRRISSFAALLGGLLSSPRVHGQDAMTKATAEALFADGRRLVGAGEYAAACPKFAASQKLDPGVGTSLNLADCYERMGRWASAWAEFRSATSTAHSSGSRERAELAAGRARALEDCLSYLTITSAAPPAGVVISRDGSPLEPAVLGTPIPVDPGSHTIEAAAAGKRKWSVAVDVGPTASRVTVNVPPLGDGVSPSHSGATTASDPARYGGAQRAVGIGAGVLGLMGVAAGTVFGLKASTDWGDAKARCRNYPQGCDNVAVGLAQDARAASSAATVAFVIGSIGLAGGAVIYFTAPRNANTEKGLSAGIQPWSVAVSGRF